MRPLFLCLQLLLTACSSEPPPMIGRGDLPPAFNTARLDGSQVRFPADFAGKPVVIRFWADWCHYCEGEMKGIEPIYLRYKEQGIEMLAVNAGQDRAKAQAFVGKLGISYPALLDEDAAIARRYGVVGLPTTYFVGREGRVAAKHVGEMTGAAFEQRIEELLR